MKIHTAMAAVVMSLAVALWGALPVGAIVLAEPDLFRADTLAVIPDGKLATSLAFPTQDSPAYPAFLYITARESTPSTGVMYTMDENGALSAFGSATHDDLRLAFGEGSFSGRLYGVDPSWPGSYTDGVYRIPPDGVPELFSSLGGDNPDAMDILFGASSTFGDFLFVASINTGTGGSDFDTAISRLNASGAFAGQLVQNSSGPLAMALTEGGSFGTYIYYTVYSTEDIYRVAPDGTNSLFTAMPAVAVRFLAISPGGAFGDYIYTGGGTDSAGVSIGLRRTVP